MKIEKHERIKWSVRVGEWGIEAERPSDRNSWSVYFSVHSDKVADRALSAEQLREFGAFFALLADHLGGADGSEQDE